MQLLFLEICKGVFARAMNLVLYKHDTQRGPPSTHIERTSHLRHLLTCYAALCWALGTISSTELMSWVMYCWINQGPDHISSKDAILTSYLVNTKQNAKKKKGAVWVQLNQFICLIYEEFRVHSMYLSIDFRMISQFRPNFKFIKRYFNDLLL